MKIIIKFILILYLISTKLFAQPDNPIFYSLGSNLGLVSDKTTCVVQDHLGFIWIGSEEGLSRYTGYSSPNKGLFTNYKHNSEDNKTINDDFITTILKDHHQNLWIGTYSGLCQYNFETDKFDRIDNPNTNVLKQPIFSINQLDNNLLISTKNNLYIFDTNTRQIAKEFNIKDEGGNPVKIRSTHIEQSKAWVGTSNGLYLIEEDKLYAQNTVGNLDITAIAMSGRSLYLGTQKNGLFHFKDQREMQAFSENSQFQKNSNKINDIKILKDKSIWVATETGLKVFNKDNKRLSKSYEYDFNNWYGISDTEIRSIYEDNTGGLWFTTPFGGLSFYHQSDNLFDYYTQKTDMPNEEELLDFSVLSMEADAFFKKIWIGTRKGLSLFDINNKTFKHYAFKKGKSLYRNQILSISQTDNGDLWLGTKKGLFKWNHQTRVFRELDDYTINDQVNIIYKDQKENLWIGTKESGLFSINNVSKILKPINFGESETGNNFFSLSVNDIIQDGNGVLWLGTTGGLFYLKDNTMMPFVDDQNNEFSPWINDLSISPAGEILIATKQKGLLKLDVDKEIINVANLKCGLPTNNISAVVYNEIGNDWWLSTDKGLSKIKTKNGDQITVENFNVHDGLQGSQFSTKTGVIIADQIFFGGLNGLTHFNPKNVILKEFPLNLTIFSLSIDDKVIKSGDENEILSKALSVTDSITLPANHKSFSLDLRAIDYLRPDSLRYQYKLENYDQKWHESNSNIVTYTSLKKGKNYTFRVKAKSRLREWSEEKTLNIYIIPYFYETVWFKIFIGLTILIIFFSFVYIREQRSRKQKIKLEKLVHRRTQALINEIKVKEKTAAELSIAAEEAKKADKAKSEFLAKISHEMRTPLNGIMGITSIAKDQKNHEEKNNLIDLIYRSSQSLKGIIDDLLDFGKIEFDKIKIVEDELDISKIANDLISSFSPQCIDKSILLKLDLDNKIPKNLLGDALRIKQVLINLLSNAIKFTDKGFVKITIDLVSKTEITSIVKFQVEDTGIGIAVGKRDQVFKSFEQIDNGLSRKYEGTGLGLAISQRLVKLMGDEIKVSGEEGKGSNFEFTISLKNDKDKKLIEKIPENEINSSHRILLVEDNPVNVLVATKMLQKLNQKVQTANNGKEALDILEREEFDLILMDIQMPIMDGFETTDIIRKSNTHYTDIPIIALTAGVMKNDLKKYFDHGMNNFLSKPVEYTEMKEMLVQYLNAKNVKAHL